MSHLIVSYLITIIKKWVHNSSPHWVHNQLLGSLLWVHLVDTQSVLKRWYITLRHFKRQLQLQWPMVHQQSHSSSQNASIKRWVFKRFLKVSVFVSSWRFDGREFHAFGPENEKLRSPNFSFNRGGSFRKLLENLSLPRPGRSATDVIMSDRYAGLWPARTSAWARRAPTISRHPLRKVGYILAHV